MLTPSKRPNEDDDDADDDDDDADEEEEVSQGRRSRTPPPKSRDGVRLSVTSPPPAFANNSTALSPPSASVISPFGSPSGWISSGHEAGTASAERKTSNVHINGDHVTQVRVDAIVLTPSTSTDRRKNQDVGDDDIDDIKEKQEKEEDRDQSELLVTTRLAVSPSNNKGRDQMHVTAVQVEHTSNAHHEDPTT